MLLLYTDRTLPRGAKNAVIRACHPSKQLIGKLGAFRDASALIVLPWKMEDIEIWVAARGHKDLLGKADTEPSTVSNPVVVRALESIRHRINVSTGISHPLDRDPVIEAFRILREKEHFDPVAIRSWFVQQWMDPGHADDVAKIAANPSRFRRNTSRSSWANDILNQWRAE